LIFRVFNIFEAPPQTIREDVWLEEALPTYLAGLGETDIRFSIFSG